MKFAPGFPKGAQPGDYAKVPPGIDPRGDDYWYVLAPDGGAGALAPNVHQVTEHEDGAITVSPSIVMPNGWHGFLTQGQWT